VLREAHRGARPHEELLAAGGLYSELYRTQFRGQDAPDDDEVVAQAS